MGDIEPGRWYKITVLGDSADDVGRHEYERALYVGKEQVSFDFFMIPPESSDASWVRVETRSSRVVQAEEILPPRLDWD